jgi:PAS domain S-box-containing protein
MSDSPFGSLLASRFDAFFDAAPDAMIVVDGGGTIVLANALAESLFGYTRDELIGGSIELLVPMRLRGTHSHHRDQYARDPHPRPIHAGLDLFGRRKDGAEFPAEISLSPLETDRGLLVISAVRDVTDRRRLEDDIRRQSRMKSEFLANMSHELRTPLNSIVGFAELMHDGRVGPMAAEHVEYLGDILASARHLLQLINDILDLSKIESGKMEFFPEPIDVGAIVEQLCDLLRMQSETKHIHLETRVDAGLTGVVLDSAKLKQVLYNFLSNALKFTADGGRVSVRASVENAEEFRLEVEDDGVGIRREDLPQLFVEFHQLDTGAGKRYQGSGLGLALTKRIVEAQGGRVGVESEPGRGSRFYAILPRAMPPR